MLAIESGIPASVWWREDERTLATGLDILHKARAARRSGERRDQDDEGRVTGG